MNYLKQRTDVPKMAPDYRGGLAYAKGFGRLLTSAKAGVFFEMNDDAVFISRFQDDVLISAQNRVGYTFAPAESAAGFQAQFLWNTNINYDIKRQMWANFLEYGPGVRLRFAGMPKSLSLSVSALRGNYLLNDGSRAPLFHDLRAGLWYAFTR